MFGFNEKPKVPLRHRTSPYMNLAFQKLPTIHGTWYHEPSTNALKMYTDGDIHKRADDYAETYETNVGYIQIDLGQVYEVYEIMIYSGYGGGYMTSNSSNTGTIELKTGLTNVEADATKRDSQTTTSTSYIPITLHYEGEGIPVRYVFFSMKSDGTYHQFVRIGEIEVFGC